MINNTQIILTLVSVSASIMGAQMCVCFVYLCWSFAHSLRRKLTLTSLSLARYQRRGPEGFADFPQRFFFYVKSRGDLENYNFAESSF